MKSAQKKFNITRTWIISGIIFVVVVATAPTAHSQSIQKEEGARCTKKDTLDIKIGETTIILPNQNATVNNLGMFDNADDKKNVSCEKGPIKVVSISNMQNYLLPDLTMWKNAKRNSDGETLRVRELNVVMPNVNIPARVVPLLCQVKNVTKYKSDGVSVCVGSVGNSADSYTHVGFMAFNVDQSRFATFTSENLAFECAADAPRGGLHWCSIGFQINADVQLNITFYPPESGYTENFIPSVIEMLDTAKQKLLNSIKH